MELTITVELKGSHGIIRLSHTHQDVMSFYFIFNI